MQRPYVQIFKGDWKQDQSLQCCSLAAQAAWLLIIMSLDETKDSPAPGFLLKPDGAVPNDDELARMMGRSREEIVPLVDELDRNRVFSRVSEADALAGGVVVKLPRGHRYVMPVDQSMVGAIYSRRMLRDLAKVMSKRRDPKDQTEESADQAQTSSQTYPQTLVRARAFPDPIPIPDPNSLSVVGPAPATDVDVDPDCRTLFEDLKARWNAKRELLAIPELDFAESNAFYANVFLPRQQRGMTPAQIREDCELLVERAAASDVVTGKASAAGPWSFSRLASRPAHLASVISGNWASNTRQRAKSALAHHLAQRAPPPPRGQQAQLRELARELEESIEEEEREGPLIEVTSRVLEVRRG